MPTLKQRTVNGVTIELKRYSADKPGERYEYCVKKNGIKVRSRIYSRQRAEREFKEVAENATGGLPGFGDAGAAEFTVDHPALDGADTPWDGGY